MRSTPIRSHGPIDQQTEKTVRERLSTFDEDVKTAGDARQALAEIRKNLKTPLPR